MQQGIVGTGILAYNRVMEYFNEIEEAVFEPAFGYGYEPDAKKKKKQRGTPDDVRFKGMKKPLANPMVPILVSLLFAALLLICVLLVSFSKKPEVTACTPRLYRDVCVVTVIASDPDYDV